MVGRSVHEVLKVTSRRVTVTPEGRGWGAAFLVGIDVPVALEAQGPEKRAVEAKPAQPEPPISDSELYERVVVHASRRGRVSVDNVRLKFHVGDKRALNVIDKMARNGLLVYDGLSKNGKSGGWIWCGEKEKGGLA